MKLHQFPLSGNSHKIRLMLGLLGLPYEAINVSGAQGQHKAPAFLAMNPFGQVPVLEDGDVVVRDSQAILVYLAQAYGAGKWWPQDAASAAAVVAWLSTAANEVARGPNLLRLHHKFGRAIDVDAAVQVTQSLLALLNEQLQKREWLVGASATIADVAIYPYIALAPEGQVDLAPYPHVLRWLDRVQALPGYVGMDGMAPASPKTI